MEKINNKLFGKLNRKSMSAIKGGETYEPTQRTSGSTGWTICDRDYFDDNRKYLRTEWVGLIPNNSIPCDTIKIDTVRVVPILRA